MITEGGRLEIFFVREEDHAWVGFRDTGTGIPRDNLQHIQRPFFTTKLAGTGLGLSVSAAIIHDLDGELRVESEAGRGTTVQIILPFHAKRAISQPRLFG